MAEGDGHLEDGALPQQALWQVLAGELSGRLQLFVPVPGLSRNMLLLTELRGEGILSPR